MLDAARDAVLNNPELHQFPAGVDTSELDGKCS
jgi:hypothetical protein